MARFDVHRCRRPGVPYVLDNQADFLARLPTRLVIPLLPAAAIARPIDRLHLRVTVAGAELILAVNLTASLRRGELGEKIASLADRHSDIVAAVDFLQQGF
ncbi:MAG: CcdB family protein [Geminicoccaceae bacterium]|jgi:toxin CcdB